MVESAHIAPGTDRQPPKLRRKKLKIPEDMKKELGIDSKAQTVASAVESLPEVQDALQ